jgi:hypothetical protein
VEFGGTAVLDGWLHIEGAGELGVEQIAASDEVGFDVDGELGEATVALNFAKTGSRLRAFRRRSSACTSRLSSSF